MTGQKERSIEGEPQAKDPYGFVNLFHQRLEQTKPLENVERGYFREIGIDKVLREEYVIVFEVEQEKERRPRPLHLWVRGPNTPTVRFITGAVHYNLVEEAQNHAPSGVTVSNYPAAAMVLQDNKGNIYLVADQMSEARFNLVDSYRWANLASSYGIAAIVKVIRKEEISEMRPIRWSKYVIETEYDYLGVTRERRYLESYARRYEMTNSQYLRFKSLAKAFMQNSERYGLDRLAQDIISE